MPVLWFRPCVVQPQMSEYAMTDLARLASDIEFAKTIAETSTANLKDDGACNLDSTFFRLKKGERSGPIVLAFARNGVHASVGRWIGMRGVFLSPPGSGCANRRHAANEAFLDALKVHGWPVLGYYQLD